MWKSDLNWLPTSVKKGIQEPTIIWEPPNTEYGGYYTLGTTTLIVTQNSTFIATIAHEFKHYEQFVSGSYKQDKIATLDFNLSYEDMITDFFLKSSKELDALLFEYKVAKCWLNEWWLNKLVLTRKTWK